MVSGSQTDGRSIRARRNELLIHLAEQYAGVSTEQPVPAGCSLMILHPQP